MYDKIQRLALEHPLVDHCNLACVACDHGSPLITARFSSLDVFQRDMSALKKVLFVRTLKFAGGEPLLHPRIADFLDVARSSGVAERLEIWTNGTLLHRIDEKVFSLVDYVKITRYPAINIRISMSDLEGLAAKYGFRFSTTFCAEFQECITPYRHNDMEYVGQIFKECKNTNDWSCHSFRDGYYYKCSRAPYIKLLRGRDANDVDWTRDAVALDRPDLRVALEEYLNDRTPLSSCQWCLGTSGPLIEHRQLGNRGKNSGLTLLSAS